MPAGPPTLDDAARLDDTDRLDNAGTLEAIAVPLLLADAAGRVRFANLAWRAWTGQDAAALAGTGWQQAAAPEGREELAARWDAATSAGRPATLVTALHDAAGAPHPVRIALAPLPDGCWIATCTELPELPAGEAQFRLIAQSMPLIVWSCRPDGYNDFYNHHWYDYTGCAPGEADGTGWARFAHPEDVAAIRPLWHDAVQLGTAFAAPFRLRGRGGLHRWFLACAEPIHDPATGAITRWLGVAVDIDEMVAARKALARSHAGLEREVADRTQALREANARLLQEAAEHAEAEAALRQSQKMEALGQLTGGIAHDFNNLLAGILGNLELACARLDAGRVAEVRPLLEAAAGAGQRGAALTARLLGFARQQPLDPVPVDVNALVRNTTELFGRTVGAGVELCTALDGQDCRAICDANQLENALLNLVINARDAMPQGGRLTISTGRRDGHVALEVADTGSGMPDSVRERAFDPFFTTKPVGQGTGLGLSMVYGFVRQSGGEARIDSAPGRGTRVTLLLPALLSPA
jgi:PAS domain S-box-containing protein